ncbi:hypothetical protein [Listeria rustica]|uniref:Uncharacterized protein n=1 Tax=Listeria rustica TaxID=2713503 RepID=A0A7W1YFD9_9LIST|nr:hypothetical protein [Listeria rustica]MBA3925532.1 hypothetical protein [Listeria rustica]
MNSLDKEMKRLGFNVAIPQLLYTRDIGKHTTLLVEGEFPPRKMVPAVGVYVYTFYKARYEFKDGRMSHVKVYAERRDVRSMLFKVKKHLEFLAENQIISK